MFVASQFSTFVSSNQIANAKTKMSFGRNGIVGLTFEIVVGTRILCENRFQSKLRDLDDERHT